MNVRWVLTAILAIAALFAAVPAEAGETTAPIVVRAGKADSPYHALARQFAEAVALAGNGTLTVEVKESQGSVQNVMEAARRKGNYVFTATPGLIAQARRGDKPFRRDRRYADIRALFPIPSQTMHWVVRQDSGVTSFADLAGHAFIPGGKGSFGERMTATLLQVLGLEGRVRLIDIDLGTGNAPSALLGKDVTGAALAGTYPMPAVLELARTTPIRLLGLNPDELAKVLAAEDSTIAQTIPKGTYPGVNADVITVALPAGAYSTRRMSDRVAYAITKAFWSQKAKLDARNPPWEAVTPAGLAVLGAKLHPGALKYYREAGIPVPAALR